MPAGYFETSIVAGPFSKRSTRALVSVSSGSSARAAVSVAASMTNISFSKFLESICCLKRKRILVQVQCVAIGVDEVVEVALEERVCAFENQRIGDVVVEAKVVLVDVAALLMFATVSEDCFHAVDQRP